MPLPIYKKAKSHINKMIAIAAGKGGVGKSFVAANLARALKKKGFKVGILDADLYGPSLKKMLPESLGPSKEDDLFIPAKSEGISIMTMAHFRTEADGVIIRAPIATKLINQFINETAWGELDYLIIDFPPGTGDIAITLAQTAKLDGVILVTTPQEIAMLDVRRAAKMFEDTGVKVVGIVENMSYLIDHETNKLFFPFGQGGGSVLSNELQVPLLAQIPLEPEAGKFADLGFSLYLADKSSLNLIKKIFDQITDHLSSWQPIKTIKSMKPLDEAAFLIEWEDGSNQRFNLKELQERCPCANCQGDNAVTHEVRAKGVLEAGRYAIKIDFETGCKNGIFPYEYLRKLGHPVT